MAERRAPATAKAPARALAALPADMPDPAGVSRLVRAQPEPVEKYPGRAAPVPCTVLLAARALIALGPSRPLIAWRPALLAALAAGGGRPGLGAAAFAIGRAAACIARLPDPPPGAARNLADG